MDWIERWLDKYWPWLLNGGAAFYLLVAIVAWHLLQSGAPLAFGWLPAWLAWPLWLHFRLLMRLLGG